MNSLLIVLNDFPYKTDKVYNALRMADTAVDTGVKVSIFLMGDSVYTARKGQHRSPELPNLEEMAGNLVARGVELKLCTSCVNSRGFEPKEGEIGSCFLGTKEDGGLMPADLIDGAQMSTMADFVGLVDSSDKVVSF